MEYIGNFVIYLIMLCAIVGAFAAIRNSETGLGKEFMEGIHLIGHIFIPVAGIMASIPYLSQLIKFIFAQMELSGRILHLQRRLSSRLIWGDIN